MATFQKRAGSSPAPTNQLGDVTTQEKYDRRAAVVGAAVCNGGPAACRAPRPRRGRRRSVRGRPQNGLLLNHLAKRLDVLLGIRNDLLGRVVGVGLIVGVSVPVFD